MLIEPHGAVTYSLFLPDPLGRGQPVAASYELFDRWVVAALQEIGAPARYAPPNDIVTAAGKLCGAAQARRRGVVLHHATLAYEMDNDRMRELIRIGKPALGTRGVRSAEKTVDPLNRYTSLSREAVAHHLATFFDRQCRLRARPVTEEELDAAHTLAREKYRCEEWTRDVP
jgi:lipoate-protein ligase A